MGRKASRRRERRTADLASPETAWAEALAGQILGFHKKSLPKTVHPENPLPETSPERPLEIRPYSFQKNSPSLSCIAWFFSDDATVVYGTRNRCFPLGEEPSVRRCRTHAGRSRVSSSRRTAAPLGGPRCRWIRLAIDPSSWFFATEQLAQEF